jgi:hypothetical protein
LSDEKADFIAVSFKGEKGSKGERKLRQAEVFYKSPYSKALFFGTISGYDSAIRAD